MGDVSGHKTYRSIFYQQAKNVQTDVCRQCFKEFAGFICFHKKNVQHYLKYVNKNSQHSSNIRAEFDVHLDV